MAGTTQVAVVDGDEIFERGLAAVIADEPDLELCYSGSSWALCHSVDVAVVSPAAVATAPSDSRLVVCSADTELDRSLSDSPDVCAILNRNALPRRQLIEAIKAVAVGLRIQACPATSVLTSPLGDRQLRVLALLADGASTGEIADTLGYSPRTIKQVISEVNRSLAVRTRTAAVATALRAGVI